MTYHVTWEIQIDAESSRAAAQKAFEYMQSPSTTATCFDVYDENAEPCHVDLLDNDEVPIEIDAEWHIAENRPL